MILVEWKLRNLNGFVPDCVDHETGEEIPASQVGMDDNQIVRWLRDELDKVKSVDELIEIVAEKITPLGLSERMRQLVEQATARVISPQLQTA